MPPRDIRFATTDDGVGIAFWEIGSGRPLVIVQNVSINHLEAEWTVPSIASLYTELADSYRVIRLDARGFGMSENPFPVLGKTPAGAQIGMNIDKMGLDIAAVAAASGLETFALMAVGTMGPVGLEFAATHPDIVTHLILCEAVARIKASWLHGFVEGYAAISRVARDSGTEIPVAMWESVVPAGEIGQWIELSRLSGATRDTSAILASQMGWDATGRLGDIKASTLVMTARNDRVDRLKDAQRLAAGIPHSQLRVIDGAFAPYVAERAEVHAAINELLQPDAPRSHPTPSGFRTVVFTDIVGSTAFLRRVGDHEGRRIVRDLENHVAARAGEHGGRIVKNLGDGSLVSFGSNASAIDFGLDVQRRTDGDVPLRIGMSAGEPLQEDGDIHGAVVAQASRVADLAGAGEVLVSDTVRQLAIGKGFTFESKGEVTLKGFDVPVEVWKVVPR